MWLRKTIKIKLYGNVCVTWLLVYNGPITFLPEPISLLFEVTLIYTKVNVTEFVDLFSQETKSKCEVHGQEGDR